MSEQTWTPEAAWERLDATVAEQAQRQELPTLLMDDLRQALEALLESGIQKTQIECESEIATALADGFYRGKELLKSMLMVADGMSILERDALRAHNARMTAALVRIAGQGDGLEACPNHEGRIECLDCYLPWPRELRADDRESKECWVCIARTARAATAKGIA